MASSDQKINKTRYQIIPRVLIFAFRPDQVLLIKLLPRDGKVTGWTGKYNGPGGHVEKGEDILTAARRELFEETGLKATLVLCGTVIVNTSQAPGIGLFVFRADNVSGNLISSDEGISEWIRLDQIQDYPLVEDVAVLLARIRQMQPGDAPFAACSEYDQDDRLVVSFGE